MSEDEKWKILLWLSGLPLTVAELKTIPDDHLIDVIVCLHLYKLRAMSILGVECMMRSIVAAYQRTPLPGFYSRVPIARLFNVGFVYMKTFYILRSCIAAVGLDTFKVRLFLETYQLVG